MSVCAEVCERSVVAHGSRSWNSMRFKLSQMVLGTNFDSLQEQYILLLLSHLSSPQIAILKVPTANCLIWRSDYFVNIKV